MKTGGFENSLDLVTSRVLPVLYRSQSRINPTLLPRKEPASLPLRSLSTHPIHLIKLDCTCLCSKVEMMYMQSGGRTKRKALLDTLPLQKAARQHGNSEFVDENFESYRDQWAFLSAIRKLSEENIECFISKLCAGHELGDLKIDDEDESVKPWENHAVSLQKSDFPERMEIVRANMLFIPKAGISQRALNRIRRLASFRNPMLLS